mmetsp:Transcript_2930/g.7103  ORF Transcript_2930/g.7103 Transcript_2930/m.7103 type:complete len:110 (-) Transcript_2930:199-528(-)
MAADPPRWPAMHGDPRRPGDAKPYTRAVLREEDMDADWRAILSLVCGLAGLFTKNPYFCWTALFASIAGMATMKHPEQNMRQAVTALTFSLSGLLGAYMKIVSQRNKED